jgi:hypothetical protein
MDGSGTERAGSGPEPPARGDAHYDSFLVRTWGGCGPAPFARVELRHIQTGHAIRATTVDLEWLASALIRFIGAPHDPPPG